MLSTYIQLLTLVIIVTAYNGHHNQPYQYQSQNQIPNPYAMPNPNQIVIPPFYPSYVKIVNECSEVKGQVCLELPDEKTCEKNLKQPLQWCLPVPWWYFYCQQLLAIRDMSKKNNLPTKPIPTTTQNPFYRRMLDKVQAYKKKVTSKGDDSDYLE